MFIASDNIGDVFGIQWAFLKLVSYLDIFTISAVIPNHQSYKNNVKKNGFQWLSTDGRLTTPTASKANRVVPTNRVYFLGSPINGLEEMGGRSVNTYQRTIPSPTNVMILASWEKGANSFKFLIRLMATKGINIIII